MRQSALALSEVQVNRAKGVAACPHGRHKESHSPRLPISGQATTSALNPNVITVALLSQRWINWFWRRPSSLPPSQRRRRRRRRRRRLPASAKKGRLTCGEADSKTLAAPEMEERSVSTVYSQNLWTVFSNLGNIKKLFSYYCPYIIPPCIIQYWPDIFLCPGAATGRGSHDVLLAA